MRNSTPPRLALGQANMAAMRSSVHLPLVGGLAKSWQLLAGMPCVF